MSNSQTSPTPALEEMSMDLAPDEIIFYVDVPPDNPEPILTELKELGYDPKLQRYIWYRDGNPDAPVTETCALLHRSFNAAALIDELEEKWAALWNVFGDRVALAMGE